MNKVIISDHNNGFNTKMSTLESIRNMISNSTCDDAFYVLDVDDIVEKISLWRQLLPRVDIYYAVKCNHHPTAINMLTELGLSFDCASKSEIDCVIERGVPASKIIYAHPCKSVSHLLHARDAQVSLMTFDTASELYKIKQYYPSAKLVLRLRFDDDKAKLVMGEKFGVWPDNAKSLLAKARNLDLSIVGVSFHVGSGCTVPAIFYHAIAAAKKIFCQAVEEGFKPYILDIGGGFPGDDRDMMLQLAQKINSALNEFFPADQNIKIIGEPGRYIVSTAYTLTTSIIGKKEHMDAKGHLSVIEYTINDSVFMSFVTNNNSENVRTLLLVQYQRWQRAVSR